MDSYNRKKHYYQQSPAMDQNYGPQYAQQQQQHYAKGPSNPKYKNVRKHAYSVDNRHAHRQPKSHQYNYDNKQYIEQQQQQQYEHSQQIQKQRNERRKHRQQQNSSSNSSQSSDDEYNSNQRKQRRASHQNHLDNNDSDYAQRKRSKSRRKSKQNGTKSPRKTSPRKNGSPRKIRSKSPRNDNIKSPRKVKRSVPNVDHNGHHNHNQHKKRVPHQSTPNAMNANGHKSQQSRRRRRSKNNADDKEQQNGYSERPMAPRKRGRSKSPNPEPSDYDEPYPHDQIKERKRRHTTQPNQNGRRQRRSSRNPDKRKRKKSSSRHPHKHKSAADVSKANHAKLNKGKLAEKFIIREKLGRGNFSVVRRVIRKEDDKEFAAKIISKKSMTEQEIQETHAEVDILFKLHHPNIVTLVDYIFTPRHLYIVLELLNGGELFNRLQKKKKFNEQMAANITKQIAGALQYMHSHGVVHRDLKPENILYENKSDDAKIKISDFGLSRDKTVDENRPLKTSCGTPGYVAPEIIRQQIYDESVDLWATGVIILCGFPPFQGYGQGGQQKMFRQIKKGQYSYPKPAWSNISACAMDCIDSLLCVNPKDRMTATELLEHPWIKQSEQRNEDSFMDIHFQSNLSNYLHKQRFRRGVRLIITLNRMVRGAGLEETAREQRRQFRERYKEIKKAAKAEKRRIYDLQQKAKQNGNINDDDYDDEFMHYTIIDPDATPIIDYSKV